MFTGIIEEVGTIKSVQRGHDSEILTVSASKVLEGTRIGDSIAVNGICLTVTSLSDGSFSADVMHETLNRSSLKGASVGMKVNLERAMPADGRFGGHIVSGHVDGTGSITSIRRDDNAVWFTVRPASGLMRYIVEKGSVALDGISLTVAKVTADTFSVSIIPHTLDQTVLSFRKVGDDINIETDIIGKYVEKMIKREEPPAANTGITEEFLARYGF